MNVAVLQPMFSALQADNRIHVAFACEEPSRVAAAVRQGRRCGRSRSCRRRLAAMGSLCQRRSLDTAAASAVLAVAEFLPRRRREQQPGRSVGASDRFRMVRSHRLHQLRTDGDLSDARHRVGGRAVLVGFPKADRLALGGYRAPAIRRSLGLDSSRMAALYAPGWSPAGSLHLAGEPIIASLRRRRLQRDHQAPLDVIPSGREVQRRHRLAITDGRRPGARPRRSRDRRPTVRR